MPTSGNELPTGVTFKTVPNATQEQAEALAEEQYKWADSVGFKIEWVEPVGRGYTPAEFKREPGRSSMVFLRTLRTAIAPQITNIKGKEFRFFSFLPLTKADYREIQRYPISLMNVNKKRYINTYGSFDLTEEEKVARNEAMAKTLISRGVPEDQARKSANETQLILPLGFEAYQAVPPKGALWWHFAPEKDSDTPRTGMGVDKVGGPPPVPTGPAVDPAKAAKAAGEAAGKALTAAGNKPKPKTTARKPQTFHPALLIVGGLAVGGLMLLGRKR